VKRLEGAVKRGMEKNRAREREGERREKEGMGRER